MDNQQILIAVAVIAVLALVGRIIINKNKDVKIGWYKIGLVMAVMVAFMLTFMLYNPERVRLWWKGEASLAEGKSESIAGREPGDDIPRLTSVTELVKGIYFTPVAASYEHSGYYKLKDARQVENSLERTVQDGETSHGPAQIIEHKQSTFELTKNPKEPEKYLAVYVAAFADSTKMLLAMEERDADREVKPIAVLRPIDEVMQRVLRAESDSLIINDFYLLAYDEQHGNQDYLHTLLSKGVAAAIVALLVVVVGLAVRRKR